MPYRKALLFALSLSFLLAFTTSAMGFNTYRAGEFVTGQEYNETLERWIPRTFSIWVGVSEQGREYIFFQGETSLKPATVQARYKTATVKKLKDLLNKALEWSEVARENKADTSQKLGCFGDDRYSSCENSGNAYEKNQMGLSFFASREGQQTNLIIDMIDGSNQFIKTEIYFDPPQIRQIAQAAEQIKAKLDKAHEMAGKKDLFK